jgi:hypothetical protein
VDAGGADAAAVKVGAAEGVDATEVDAVDAGTAIDAPETVVEDAAMGSHAAAVDAVVGAVKVAATVVEGAGAMGVNA